MGRTSHAICGHLIRPLDTGISINHDNLGLPVGNEPCRKATLATYDAADVFVVDVFALVEMVVIILRVSVMDLLIIVGPLMMSCMGFMAPLCMRKPVEREDRRVELKDGESV